MFQYFIGISYKWVKWISRVGYSWEKGIPYQEIVYHSHSSVYDLAQSWIFPLASEAPGTAQFLWQGTQTDIAHIWCIKDTKWI